MWPFSQLYSKIHTTERGGSVVTHESRIREVSSHYLSLTSPLSFTWPTPPGPYRATTCRGRELNYGLHTYFLTTQGHGGPPLMSDHLNAGATSETAQTWKTIHTKHTLSHPNNRIWNDDYDGQMILGDFRGLKFPDICLTGEEKPRKNLTQETCPDWGSNPGPLRDKRACYHLLHSGGL